MSPLSLRRYRAERLLREEFEGLRSRVLAKVRGRLRASGVRLDQTDLEACYAQAWQGLYSALLAGQDIANPAGWLVVVTFRRAIEEHRARLRIPGERHGDTAIATAVRARSDAAQERDVAAELDDRMRLRQLFEGLRGRLSTREREAAVLCYLQGLSRSQAAEQMGISDARLRKLMDGRGAGQTGVAGKVGALVKTISSGDWCEEQGSLMRGLAYGILDPDGERYRLAVMHRGECPACRAYVVSLRGLAVALPPVLLPSSLGAAAMALAGRGAHAGLGSAGAGATGAAPGGAAGVQLGAGIGSMSATGVAGAGGGWVLAGGPLGAKLAVGCLLVLGVGAGCVALAHSPPGAHQHHSLGTAGRDVGPGSPAVEYRQIGTGRAGLSPAASQVRGPANLRTRQPQAGTAGREFAPEQARLPGAIPRSAGSAAGGQALSARSASATLEPAAAGAGRPSQPSPAVRSAADREFAPG
ncbi:MAG: polymerase, sigma-24 subunit, subfamily [Solirubrobacterales bacterium]|nr:polymerase, sigma-24 subunit, subfamily [Solirubrobacterales bacterium]